MLKKEELLDVATLAKLNIKDGEVEKLLEEMEKIIDFANTIDSAEIEDSDFDNVNGLRNVYRQDEVVESFTQDEILKNAKTVEGGFFRLSNNEKAWG